MRRLLIPMLLCAALGTAESQARPVRLWRMNAAQPDSGTLLRRTRDSVIVSSSAATPPIALSFDRIARMEEYRWVGNGWTGFGIGLLAGAALGGVMGWMNTCGDCDGDYRPLGAMVFGTLGAAFGGVTGAIVGHGRGEEKWVNSPLPYVR